MIRTARSTGRGSPLPRGEFEIPLVIADRAFFTDGELDFPRESPNPFLPYWDAEDESNVVVVNGKAWPNLNVQRRQYRFRLLAASNMRIWQFQFAARPLDGEFLPFTIIGSDGGYLPRPRVVDRFTAGITERTDLLVRLLPVRARHADLHAEHDAGRGRRRDHRGRPRDRGSGHAVHGRRQHAAFPRRR